MWHRPPLSNPGPPSWPSTRKPGPCLLLALWLDAGFQKNAGFTPTTESRVLDIAGPPSIECGVRILYLYLLSTRKTDPSVIGDGWIIPVNIVALATGPGLKRSTVIAVSSASIPGTLVVLRTWPGMRMGFSVSSRAKRYCRNISKLSLGLAHAQASRALRIALQIPPTPWIWPWQPSRRCRLCHISLRTRPFLAGSSSRRRGQPHPGDAGTVGSTAHAMPRRRCDRDEQ
ncbi:hypothetical protein CSHISOI_05712 [Colletotrichum shisoi]|uniref:Uncharacterized protein n=1 Tax=Colletotrichum shisoi TaxID=2078593 RepID=A0A5Q4BPN3_9PEZI|nr:hypothetical protein CSHISOI_05712 [Colletotrichum shisoi]